MASQLIGTKELLAKLKKLSKTAEPKQIRSAVSFALTPVKNAASANAPRGSQAHKTYKGRLVAPGFLARSIKKTARVSRDKQSVIGSVGPSREAFYGTQFIELGTKNIRRAPWLEPAYSSKEQIVIKRFADKLEDRIKKAAR